MNQDSNTRITSICFLRSVGTDDSVAFDQAIRICQKSGASLTIMSVVDEVPEGLFQLLAAQISSAETISGEAEERIECERLQSLADSQGVKAASIILRGNRFLEVSKQVQNHKHEILIKSPEPSSGIQSLLLGHIDRQLIRKCPCTVWIQKPTYRPYSRRVVAAVDPAPFLEESEVDPVRRSLNIAIMNFASSLAAIEDAELHVVHVWSFYIESALRWRAGMGDDAIAEVGSSMRSKHQAALDQLVMPYMDQVTRVHLLKGHAGEELARFTASEAVDLLVMGTMCRTGIEGFLIGNTAETVLDHANCSIAALKPSGFVSPVNGH